MTPGRVFVNLSNPAGFRLVQWARNAPRWRQAVAGLCLEGRCDNQQCEAYRQMVIMGIGYRAFDLSHVRTSNCHCPVCNKWVSPSTCAFNNCWWCWHGFKQIREEAEPEPCFGEWQYAADAYHYVDEQQNGRVHWPILKLEARAP